MRGSHRCVWPAWVRHRSALTSSRPCTAGLGAISSDDVEEDEEEDEEGVGERYDPTVDWRGAGGSPAPSPGTPTPLSAASSPKGLLAAAASALRHHPHGSSGRVSGSGIGSGSGSFANPIQPPPPRAAGPLPPPHSPFLRGSTWQEGSDRGPADYLRRASQRLRGKAELPDLVVAAVEVDERRPTRAKDRRTLYVASLL